MLEPPLLFDLDGTLVDSLPDIAATINAVRESQGHPVLSLAAVRGMVGDGLTKLLERALPSAKPEQMKAAKRFYREHHLEQCTRLVRTFAGVHDHLLAWQDRGWPMAVVTNKSAVFAERILDHLDLRRFFPVLVDGESVAAKKPSPEPCLRALRELGASGGTMIGDGVQDLRAGKAAGLRTVGALFGYREPHVLRAEGANAFWSAFGVAE